MSVKKDRGFMELAIKWARAGIKKGQSPFGACIVKNDKVIACAHNTVWKDTDVTEHAEINAIKKANRKLKKIHLDDCTIYSTTEPCPMCFTAIHWSHIGRIVFGTDMKDSSKYGFNELKIPDKILASHQKRKIRITEGFMREECLELFKEWKKSKGKKY